MRSPKPWDYLQSTHTNNAASSASASPPQVPDLLPLVKAEQHTAHPVLQQTFWSTVPQGASTISSIAPGFDFDEELPGQNNIFDLAMRPAPHDDLEFQLECPPIIATQGPSPVDSVALAFDFAQELPDYNASFNLAMRQDDLEHQLELPTIAANQGPSPMDSVAPGSGFAEELPAYTTSFGMGMTSAPHDDLEQQLLLDFPPLADYQDWDSIDAPVPNTTHAGAIAPNPPGHTGSFGASAPPLRNILPQAFPPAAPPQGFQNFSPIVPNASASTAARGGSSRRLNARPRGVARRGQTKPGTWNKDEERILVHMRNEGRTWAEIGRVLGKSVSAVQGKKWRLDGGDPKAYKNNCNGRRGDGRGGRGGGGMGGDGGRGGSGGASGIAA